MRVLPIVLDILCTDMESRRNHVVLPSLKALAAIRHSEFRSSTIWDLVKEARVAARGALDAMHQICLESQMNVIGSIETIPEERLYIQQLELNKDTVNVASYAVHAVFHAVQTASELVDVHNGLASVDAVHDSAISTLTNAHRAFQNPSEYQRLYSGDEQDFACEESPYSNEFWSAIESDVMRCEQGTLVADKKVACEPLFDTPLWPIEFPIAASRRWADFKEVLALDKSWTLWTDWYEACITGKSSHSAQEIWDKLFSNKDESSSSHQTDAVLSTVNETSDVPTDNQQEPDFQVALSFAGEQRGYVDEVARHLAVRSIKVFYDDFVKTYLWGKDGVEELHRVYAQRSRYVVMFISSDYASKVWTRHESRSALSRMLKEQGDYILPVRFDETPIPGLPETVFYLDANELSPAQLATKIAEKLGIPKFSSKASDVPPPRKTSPTGVVMFDYSSYNGCYVIGSEDTEFETQWSKASNTSVHTTSDQDSINGVAIAAYASRIHEVKEGSQLDFTSRVRTPNTGQIVVLRNQQGFYAAVQILSILDSSRGDARDELHFRYAIQVNGTDNFEDFRDCFEL